MLSSNAVERTVGHRGHFSPWHGHREESQELPFIFL